MLANFNPALILAMQHATAFPDNMYGGAPVVRLSVRGPEVTAAAAAAAAAFQTHSPADGDVLGSTALLWACFGRFSIDGGPNGVNAYTELHG